jgi:hypothetical protein
MGWNPLFSWFLEPGRGMWGLGKATTDSDGGVVRAVRGSNIDGDRVYLALFRDRGELDKLCVVATFVLQFEHLENLYVTPHRIPVHERTEFCTMWELRYVNAQASAQNHSIRTQQYIIMCTMQTTAHLI